MPTVINGLPAHILLVHAVVVLVPLAAVLTVLSAAWPAARARLGVVTPLLALVALGLVPVTTNAGRWLQRRVPDNPQIRHHANLGHGLLPWVVVLFVVAGLGYVLHRAVAGPLVAPRNRQIAGIALIVLAVGAGTGTVVQTIRIGDSGSKAVWGGIINLKPH